MLILVTSRIYIYDLAASLYFKHYALAIEDRFTFSVKGWT